MDNQEIKLRIADALFERPGIWIKRVSDSEIRTRCPFCGDSKKSDSTGHFYIHINTEDNTPIMYNCFLCNEAGILQDSQLSMLDIDDVELKSAISTLNKTSEKIDRKGLTDVKEVSFNFVPPPIKLGPKTEYIKWRLQKFDLTEKDFMDMKVIPSLREFLIFNHIDFVQPSPNPYMLENDYIGFLTHGNTHILFRDITGNNKIRWIKYPILKESEGNRVFYTMASEIDLFTEDEITVNLSEGVFDILSAKYNLGYDKPNTVNIAVSGRYYDAIIMYLLSIGICGSNVILNIFADNDETFNNKNQKSLYTTSIDYYQKLMRKYKLLFGKCTVYYNTKQKDIGCGRDDIMLKSYII